ncbi:MAG TPA: tRNA (N(6)-L-threonylcarbamoyladenosine(37)-C(2))-methylthiotransferase MtaB [Terriglobia bacterium]|jgi:threonylcarbamoyladenosine tRNA methylthiotransferase MtaB
MSRTFHITNFGCRASQSEGASIHQELLDANATEAGSPYEAEVVIVNSCTVTAEADRDVRQTIRRIASRNPQAQIIVTGCYAQRAPEELAVLPRVRYVVGNSHKPMVAELALQPDLANHGRAEIICSSIFLERELEPASHLGSGGRTRAVIKIQDGCNANCSFCIIPSVRGRSRSIEPAAALDEVRELVGRGYKEVIFSGIHLGTYGRDLQTKASFYDLVCRALEIPGLERLRLSSIEPLEVVPELVDLAAAHPRMAHHFHIPLQSGSSRILRAMYRPYSAEYYADLVARVRDRIPDAGIGADVMVGFPGEADDDFRATYELIENSPLTYLHVFPYSSRPGTVSASLPNPIPDHVSKFRAKTLRGLIARKNEAFRRQMIGREIEVLTLDADSAISSNFVRVTMPAAAPLNQWIRVKIQDLSEDGLQASKITTAQETN